MPAVSIRSRTFHMKRVADRAPASPRPSRSLFATTLMVLGCALTVPSPATGEESTSDFSVSPRISLPESPEAENLFHAAQDALARGDFKAACDALQRLIDAPFAALLSADARVYSSPRFHATRMLAELPPEGLAAYRLLYGGEARALFEQARNGYDVDLLASVVERFFMTEVGDDAANLLAGWLIDQGEAARALPLLEAILTRYPDSDLPRRAIVGGQTVAAIELGLVDSATRYRGELEQLAGADAECATLLAAIRKYAEDREEAAGNSRSPSHTEDAAWPVMMGGRSRSGRMPAVVPSLVSLPDWEFNLPLEAGNAPAQLLVKQETLREYPAFYGVCDGRKLYVRSEQQVVALDLDSMREAWRTRPVVDSLARVIEDWDYDFTITLLRKEGETARVNDRNGQVLRTMLDELSASISVIGDTVYSIDRYANAEYAQFSDVFDASTADAPNTGPPAARRMAGVAVPRLDERFNTRLVALDARTGRRRWSRGRTGESRDALGAGLFSGPPVGLGESVLAVFHRGTDVFLLRLNQQDGHVEERLYLCGREEDDTTPLLSVHMAQSDNAVYVPIGGGFLICVDTNPLRLRWASAYPVENSESAYGSRVAPFSRRGGWLSNPPVIVGSAIVCAPPDANELFAFDAANGWMRWRTPRGKHRYILGAMEGRVLLGGDTVSALNADTGQAEWSVNLEPGTTTGRGALSGTSLLLPTHDALLVLDSRTGERLESIALPSSAHPLGNLLCAAGSAFSVDTLSVRKYPDLDRNYELALEQSRADPDNAIPALRLAWIETVRGNPQRVLETLAGIDLEQPGLDGHRQRQVQRLRVKAHLALADQEKGDCARAEAHIQRALDAAVDPEDARDARLALARSAVRCGRVAEGYRLFIAAMDPLFGKTRIKPDSGSIPLIEVAHGLRRSLREVVREEMQRAASNLGEAGKHDLSRKLNTELDGALKNGHWGTVSLFGELAVLNGAGERALLELAAHLRNQRRYESAEGYYLRVIAEEATAGGTARAMAELAEMYLDPQQDLLISAEALVRKMESEYGSVKIKPRLASIAGDREMAAAEVASGLRRMIDSQRLAARQEARGLQEISVSANHNWQMPLQAPGRLIQFFEGEPEAVSEGALLLVNDRDIERYELRDGHLEWPVRLHVLNLLEDDAPPLSGQDFMLHTLARPPDGVRPARALSHGQTMMIASSTGLHAIGLLTGRALWDQRMTPVDSSFGVATGYTASAGNGRVVCIDKPGQIRMLRAADGHVLWERSGRTEEFWGVHMMGDRVFVVDQEGNQVTSLAAGTGRTLARFDFTQTRSDYRPGVIILGEVVCGPRRDQVVAYESDTGKELWSLECPSAVCSIFKPGPGLAGIGSVDGHCYVIEGETGTRLLETTLPDFTAGVYDAAIEGDSLCVIGQRRLFEGRIGLTVGGVDLQSGEMIWSEQDLPENMDLAHAVVIPRMVSRFPRWLPIYDYPKGTRLGGRRLKGQNATARLSFIDKRTGRLAGPPIEFEADTTTRFTPDLWVRSNQVLILTGKYLHSFGMPIERGVQARTGRGRSSRMDVGDGEDS